MQNNLGAAYSSLPTGDRDNNLTKTIACYQAALRVRSERDYPEWYADTEYNLGVVYEELSSGDSRYRERAIACFEAAARGYSAVGLTENAEDARQHAEALKNQPSD